MPAQFERLRVEPLADTVTEELLAKVAFDAPPELDPRRALDYQNIRECMYLPVPGAAAMEKTDGFRYASTQISGIHFDHVTDTDMQLKGE